MRNNRLVMIALALVLLIGGAGAIYMVMQSNETGANGPQVGAMDDGGSLDGADGADPLKLDPGSNKGNGAETNNGGAIDPINKGTGKTSTGSSTGEVKPDPDRTDPDPAVSEYEPYTFEAVIHGRVSFKSDGRSAVGASVSVELYDGASGWGGWDRAAVAMPDTDENRPKSEVSGSATTDGAGEYSIKLSLKAWRPKPVEGLSDGDKEWNNWGSNQVIVVATMSGYAPAKSNGFYPQADEDKEQNLTLAIPAAVTGRVIDAISRKGIAGANGNMLDADSWENGGTVPSGFTTDADGYFSLNSLPAGNYVLNVNAKGYANYNGWQGQGRINLTGGGEKNLGDIALMLSATVVGRVVNAEDGTPVQGADVSLNQASQWGRWASSSGMSDEEGRFEISNVEPGSYKLKIRMDGFALFELAAQNVEPGKHLDLGDLKLDRGLQLGGRVVNTDGAGVAGAEVLLHEPAAAFNMGRGAELTRTMTGEDGTFVLSGVGNGDWQLNVEASGYAHHTQSIKISGATSDIKVTLSRGGTVTGRIIDANGNPVADVAVVSIGQESQAYKLWKAQPATMVNMLWAGTTSLANSAEDGRFRVENVAEGTYLIAAAGKDRALLYKDDVRVENEREIDIGDLRFGVHGATRITVTEDGVPVADLTVKLVQGMAWGGGSNSQGVTDAMGIALIDNVPPGTWYVRTDRDDGTFDTDMGDRRVVVKPGETAEFALELRPKGGVHLHGKLTMNGKAVFNDVMLIGTGDRSDIIKTAKTVEGGYFEFIGLKTGTYVLHARESDVHVTSKAQVTLNKEGDFPFDRDFKGYAVGGSVSTPDDSPAQRSSVSVTIAHQQNEKPEYAQWLRGRTNADADGRFNFGNVMPGTYVLTASLDGVGQAATQVTVTSADQTGLNVSITQNSGKIQISVSKLNGTPVSGAGFGLLSLATPDGTPVDLGESFQGFFMVVEGASQTMPTVEPGMYTVILKGAGYITTEKTNIVVENGKTTQVDMQLTAAAELQLTVTNAEITQAMLDGAQVRYFNAGGTEVERESSVFDNFGGASAPPERPTLKAKYLNSAVTEIRIKVAGYAELTIPVQFGIGKKIEKEESLVAE